MKVTMKNQNDNFFVILPSDSNLNVYSDNINNKYTVEFETPIELTEDHECALLDINIPGFVTQLKPFNVKIGYIMMLRNSKLKYWDFNEHTLSDITFQAKKNCTFNELLSDFADFLNEYISNNLTATILIEKFFKEKKIKYNDLKHFHFERPSLFHQFNWDVSKKIPHKLDVHHGYLDQNVRSPFIRYSKVDFLTFRIVFIFEEYVYEILRVPIKNRYPMVIHNKGEGPHVFEGESISSTQSYTCSYDDDQITPDFQGNWMNVPKAKITEHCVIVLSDIIGESHINGNRKRILKLFYSDDKGNFEKFSKDIQFFPVIRKTIKHIQIEIVDLDWQPIQFKNGPVNVVLYFRRK